MLGFDRLTKDSSKTQLNMLFGKLDQPFFYPARWWWPEITPFFASPPKKGGCGSISKLTSRRQSRTSGWTKFPPPPPPCGIRYGTKLTHKKRWHSSSWLSIMQCQLTSGAVKSWWRLAKAIPTVALSRWNHWSTSSTISPLLNKCGDMLPTSFGKSLPKKGILARATPFPCCHVFLKNFLNQPLCKTLKQFIAI